MKHKAYEIEGSDDNLRFDFTSIGPKGAIEKRVIFDEVEMEVGGVHASVFNMALVDVLEDGELSDSTRSANGDMEQVMLTVGRCLLKFFQNHPEATVYFRGSDEARTRRYRLTLSRRENFLAARENFRLFGVSENGEVFEYHPNASCEAFLIQRW